MSKNLIKEIMKQPPKSFINEKALIEKIEEGYTIGRGPKFTQKKTFSPSTLAYGHGECPRYWFLAFNGAEFADDVNAYSAANMQSGTHGHERIQKAMVDSGIAKELERKIISEDPPIFGYADVILDWYEKEIVGEIKTMRDESFAHRKSTGRPPVYHLIQILIYMKVLDHKEGVLIYENKNSHEMKVIPVTRTEEYDAFLNDLWEWLKDVRAAWDGQQLPIKQYRSNAKICKGCPVAATCDEAGKGVLDIPRMPKLEA